MKRLKVKRFLQDPSHCAVAACAELVNYYNPTIDYEYTKKLAYKKISKKIGDEGLETSEMALLLNYLGFKKVTIVSSSMNVFDYSWSKYGRKKITETLKDAILKKKDKDEKIQTKNIYKWISKTEYKNCIKIDYDFDKYIKKQLRKGNPIILTFNWTLFFKFIKDGENGGDAINGETEEHAVVANGYDNKGIWIVDSHHEYYKYTRKKYRKGFYKLPWSHLYTCMGEGDLILAEEYESNE